LECQATLPDGGWHAPSNRVRDFIENLEPTRRRLLRTRALLVVNLPIEPPVADGWFQWLKRPADDLPNSATWYIDGSAHDAAGGHVARTGFGVAVVDGAGALLAYAWGAPPSWVRTSGGAEIWAFYHVCRLNPALPRTTTDYLGIPLTLQRGKAAAIDSKKPLARAWGMIYHCLDGDVADALEAVIWMPSHESRSAIGRVTRSDGQVVTVVDWRSNRLVDCLARSAAARHRLPELQRRLLATAKEALEYSAALIGATAHASSNFPVTTFTDDGSAVTSLRRDAVPPPPCKGKWGPRKKKPATPSTPVVAPPAPPPQSFLEPRSRDQRRADAAKETTAREDEQQARFIRTWSLEMAAATRRPQPTDAATRLEALRERVRAKKRDGDAF